MRSAASLPFSMELCYNVFDSGSSEVKDRDDPENMYHVDDAVAAYSWCYHCCASKLTAAATFHVPSVQASDAAKYFELCCCAQHI